MENGLNIFDNFHKEQLDLKYSLWGTTLVHYTVVYFLNNEPLYLPDGSCLDLEVQEGMKTVIRLTMDTARMWSMPFSFQEIHGLQMYQQWLLSKGNGNGSFWPEICQINKEAPILSYYRNFLW